MERLGGHGRRHVAFLSLSVLVGCGDHGAFFWHHFFDSVPGHGHPHGEPEPGDAGSAEDAGPALSDAGTGDAGAADAGTGPSNAGDAGTGAPPLEFSNVVPLGVPTGPALVTSAIEVSGADPVLWDIDVAVSLVHTFAADLDITLTSPAGTVVTLTTDNGAGTDDVFSGVTWDDGANLGGSLPYASNGGLTTDRQYIDGEAVASVAPEEPLAAFFGEDPNGTWTLSISDDQFGDGGILDEWGLIVTAVGDIPATIVSTYVPLEDAVPLALLDPGVVDSTLEVPPEADTPHVCGVTVFTDISHGFCADLDVTLSSPSGTVVTLTSDNGGAFDNAFAGTLWDDAAAPGGAVPYTVAPRQVTDVGYVNNVVQATLTPEESLSAFRGEPAAGSWTLSVSDDAPGNAGELRAWRLSLERCSL